jgi:pilus assembly protein FimV
MTKAERREAERVAARERREQQRAAAAEARATREESAGAAPRAAATTTAAADAAGSGASEDEIKVRSGDTLSKIATRVQKQGVSLDQMLVALFRANPSAFSGNNMNRLRAGVVLSVPSAETAQAVQPAEARKTIVAQSADFGAYRQRLAEATAGATAEAEPNKRRSAGKVQTAVEDKKLAANTSPDTLKLSKGGVAPPSAPGSAEDRLAGERQRQAEAARVAELNKNLTDLKRLQGGASQAAVTPPRSTTTATPATTTPAVAPPPAIAARPASSPVAVQTPAPTPTPPLTAPTPPLTAGTSPTTTPPTTSVAPTIAGAAPPATTSSAPPTTTMAAASTPATTAPAAVTAPVVVATASAAGSAPPAAARPASAARPKPVARPAPEPSFIDSITSGNPIYLGVGALVLLLAGYGAYRYTQRSKKDSGETSFLESRLQPDSFFGASGGQRIDTRDAGGSSSSMTYSLSQLDAIGDVDPVAEADVYLAYGRDLQAEEILKEAMRSNPERLAIRTKLLEVYAKRRDIKGFELLATQLFALTRGEGDDWAKAQELGAQIDPENALYRAGGTPGRTADGTEMTAESLGASTLPQSVMPVSAPSSQFGSTIANTTARDSAFDNIDLDLDNPDIGVPSRPASLDATESIPPRPADPAAYNTTLKMPLVANEPGMQKAAERRDEPLPFDLSGISLDLDPSESADAHTTAPGGLDESGDPLSRKLELAEEFQRIGDKDGARDLLREVLATASGATKTKAQGMLDRIT